MHTDLNDEHASGRQLQSWNNPQHKRTTNEEFDCKALPAKPDGLFSNDLSVP